MSHATHTLCAAAIASLALATQSTYASSLLDLHFTGTMAGLVGVDGYSTHRTNGFYFDAIFDANPLANQLSATGICRYPISSLLFTFPGVGSFQATLNQPLYVVLGHSSDSPSSGYYVGYDDGEGFSFGLRSTFASSSSSFNARAPSITSFSGFEQDNSNTPTVLQIRDPQGNLTQLNLPANALTGPTSAYITSSVPEPETYAWASALALVAFAGWRQRSR